VFNKSGVFVSLEEHLIISLNLSLLPISFPFLPIAHGCGAWPCIATPRASFCDFWFFAWLDTLEQIR